MVSGENKVMARDEWSPLGAQSVRGGVQAKGMGHCQGGSPQMLKDSRQVLWRYLAGPWPGQTLA